MRRHLKMTTRGKMSDTCNEYLKPERTSKTSNLAFSHCVFYPFNELSVIFVKFKIVVCKPFQFRSV